MDEQLLRDILSELKKMNKKLEELKTATSGVEDAIYRTDASS